MKTLVDDIKTMIVETLDLEDIKPSEIDESEALFVDGLGLDSIDALELGVALQKKYGLKIDASASDLQEHFYSVRTLADFVSSHQAA